MKFNKGDELTWELFQEACRETEERVNKNSLDESIDNIPSTFQSQEDFLEFFRRRGCLTVDEFHNKMKEKYGL